MIKFKIRVNFEGQISSRQYFSFLRFLSQKTKKFDLNEWDVDTAKKRFCPQWPKLCLHPFVFKRVKSKFSSFQIHVKFTFKTKNRNEKTNEFILFFHLRFIFRVVNSFNKHTL